jgi:hypothetical protein
MHQAEIVDNSQVHRPLQHRGSTVRNVLHVTILVSRIWMWLLDFWKICGLLHVNIGLCVTLVTRKSVVMSVTAVTVETLETLVMVAIMVTLVTRLAINVCGSSCKVPVRFV